MIRYYFFIYIHKKLQLQIREYETFINDYRYIMLQAMANFINSTAQLINDAYDYYLWTLSLAGNLCESFLRTFK